MSKIILSSHTNQSPEKCSNCIADTRVARIGGHFPGRAVGNMRENFQ